MILQPLPDTVTVIKVQGVVTKVQSYLENDRLVFVYTKSGKLTLIAKGSQKVTSDLRILAQYLTFIEFKEVKHKNMYVLMEGKIIDSFESIKKDYQSLELASIMFDLVNHFVSENDNHETIFELLKDGLFHFSRESVLSFGFKLLKYLGYQMSLKPDGRKVKGFNLKTASLVYVGEKSELDLSLELTTILLKLSYLSYDKIEKIEDYNFIKLKSFMYDFYEYHTDTQINRK